MGTKNNPGKFDCYANAAPDEPIFVLLGRDRHAAEVVRYWAFLRLHDNMPGYEGEHFLSGINAKQRAAMPEKLQEALRCADAMAAFRKEHEDYTS